MTSMLLVEDPTLPACDRCKNTHRQPKEWASSGEVAGAGVFVARNFDNADRKEVTAGWLSSVFNHEVRLLRVSAFENTRCTPSRPRLLCDFFLGIQGQHGHRSFRSNAGNKTGRFQSVHYGHLQIKDHHVWGRSLNVFECDLAVLCLATYVPLRVMLDKHPKHAADDGIVVDDKNV